MTFSEFLALFRGEAQDGVQPYLWSDADVLRYLNRAVDELARETDYFLDRTTWAAVQAVASDPKIPATTPLTGETVPPATPSMVPIIRPVRAQVQGQSSPMLIRSVEQMDAGDLGAVDDYGAGAGSDWLSASGTPRILVTGYYDDGFRLYPTPAADALVDLHAVRRPLSELTATGQEQWKNINATSLNKLAGIRQYDHELALLEGVKKHAYRKDDADAFDEELAAKAEFRFAGMLANIELELRRNRHPGGPVAYGGL